MQGLWPLHSYLGKIGFCLWTVEAGFPAAQNCDTIFEKKERGRKKLKDGGVFRLLKRQSKPRESFDPAQVTPAIRAGICTGEKTAGFLENDSGRFREVMLIRTPEDLAEFREKYGIEGEIRTIY